MIKRSAMTALATTLLVAPAAFADHEADSTDAAIGGGLGGAAGAVLGNEVGGRNGAILGGALGAAGGAAITTDDDHGDRHHYDRHDHHGRGNFCPPGLAKQGRC